MIRIAIVVLFVAILVLALWAIKDEKLSKKSKINLTILAVILPLIAYFYEINFEKKSSVDYEILTSFNQGKVIECNDYNITKSRFNYEFGTSTFIAKREIVELNSVIVPLEECKIAK